MGGVPGMSQMLGVHGGYFPTGQQPPMSNAAAYNAATLLAQSEFHILTGRLFLILIYNSNLILVALPIFYSSSEVFQLFLFVVVCFIISVLVYIFIMCKKLFKLVY